MTSTAEQTEGASVHFRPIEARDVPALAALQRESLPGSLPELLGPRFMEAYYGALLPGPDFYCDGCFDGSRLVGFFAYSSNSSAVFGRALRSAFFRLAWAAIVGVLSRPLRLGLIARVARSIMGPGSSGESSSVEEAPGELLSLGVLAEYQGRRRSDCGGISIGQRLVTSALEALDARGVPRIKVLTKLDDDDPRVNRFFANLGFRREAVITRFGQQAQLHLREREGG